jgi:hypothetical protein
VWSHCTDGSYTYGGLGGNAGTSAWTDPFDGSREKGNCPFDIRHNLTVNVVYMLPFHGNRLVSGWQVSGIETWRTGIPFSPQIGYDRALLSNNFSSVRPNVIAGCDMTANQSIAHYYNPACFTLPAAGTIGNLGKGVLTSPGYTTLDFSLSKDTKIFERVSMQFRAEMFNILNHTNFNFPTLSAFTAVNGLAGAPTGQLANATNAGQITSTVGTSRQIQFGVKFLF